MKTPPSTTSKLLIPFLFFLAGLTSCERHDDSDGDTAAEPARGTAMAEQSDAADSHADAIPWYDGTIEAAFAQAKSEDKPLFLYWGAVWCPPCEQIKATVFKHPAFLAKSRLFIPVYLDGDTERAQSWGERFAVAGYPTMIVFSPSGEEITRIPGWIDSEQYLNVLQLALDDLTSTVDLLRRALNDPHALSAEAYTRLAYYSWEQANLPDDLVMDAAAFRALAASARDAGNAVAWSRLTFLSLYAAYGEQEDAGIAISPADRQQARQALTDILDDPDLVLANSDYMLLYFEEFLTLLTDDGVTRDALAADWLAAMQIVRQAPQLSGAEHLASWYPPVQLFRLDNPDAEHLPADLERQVVAYIDDVEGSTRGEARQNVVNTAYQVLELAGRSDLARSLLLKEVEQSHAPYYFMSSLGDLEEEAGHPADAVAWHRRAWENATGEATRFQWGYQYVDSMTRLTPEADERILATSRQLLQEFATPETVLSGRNFGRLQRLLDSLQAWHADSELDATTVSGLQDFLGDLEALCTAGGTAADADGHCQALRDADFSDTLTR